MNNREPEDLPYSLRQIQMIRQRLESIEILGTEVTFNNNKIVKLGSAAYDGTNVNLSFLIARITIKFEGKERVYSFNAKQYFIHGFNPGRDEITNFFLQLALKAKKIFPALESPSYQLAERKATLVWKQAYPKLLRAAKKKENIKKVEAKFRKATRRKMDSDLKKVFIHALVAGYELKDITRLWKELERDAKTASIMDA